MYVNNIYYSTLKLYLICFECIALGMAIYSGFNGFFTEPLANYLLIVSSISKLIKPSEPIRAGILNTIDSIINTLYVI